MLIVAKIISRGKKATKKGGNYAYNMSQNQREMR